MSLPPGFLDELRSRISLAQVVGRKVTWDMRKSNQGKGDMWASCPFHQEKTASFHVDDRKGFYYCFGCHAKGDAIGFVKDSENLGFMDAVEILAREAGMTMPARDPQAAEKASRHAQLTDVMEQALRFFRLQIKTAAAAPARDYLAGRGLDAAALERWEIGFAPDGWQALWEHLRGKGVAEDLIVDAGLARSGQAGKAPYDIFRHRIVFPIRDARGRAIAFGGRAMDPGDAAKYLNSPETALFDKGRTLFNLGPARAAAGKGQPVIVAEGYMDVIALAEAGFAAAVAPLGTAITEHQLQLLWRLAPEPIIALDGDAAGLRAALRLVDLALPLLEAGRSLRFALLPEGQDPDDLLRARGAGAFQKLIDAAVPPVQLLWQRETQGKVFDSPERKAALDRALRDKIALIRDPSIRQHYVQDIKDLSWQLFRAARRGAGAARKPPSVASASAKSSLLATGPGTEEQIREAVILAALIATPEIAAEFDARIENLTCADPDRRALRDLILRVGVTDPARLRDEIDRQLGPAPLEKLHMLRHVAIVPCIRRPGEVDLARLTVAEELAKLEAGRGLQAEVEEASEDLSGVPGEDLTWRLGQAVEAHHRAQRTQYEDTVEFEHAENGAAISLEERKALDDLLDSIEFAKPRRSSGRIKES